jgi:putative transposase
MKKKRFSTEHIIKILKEAKLGISVKQLCRKHGISEQTFYRWRNKYRGWKMGDVLKLKTLAAKSLEEENRKLKRLVTKLSLNYQILKEFFEKNF